MIRPEALALLAIADGASRTEIRSAYLRRAVGLQIDDDPAAFLGLREAYELLTHGTGATPEELAAARGAVSARPDDVEARWLLLADLSYGGGPAASDVLRDGAERQPEAFLDELLLHFPDRVSAELARRARDGAGHGRLLLLADVHATEGRPAETLEALGAALAGTTVIASAALLRLALRPIFSLQIHSRTGPAREALALVQGRMATSALDGEAHDLQTVTMFRVAVELAALDETFPLDLRQVAANAAKRGDFQNAPYEAKYATRLLKPRDVPKLNTQLKRDAPTLAGILGLTLTEAQLRPTGTPNVKVRAAWGVGIAIVVLRVAWVIHRLTRHDDTNEMLKSVFNQQVEETQKGIERDCADPNSEKCRHWRSFFANTSPDAGGDSIGVDPAVGDGGIGMGDLGTIGLHDGSSPPRRRAKSHR